MTRGLVVADDLTGACDTGHAFAASGNRTHVLVTADRPGPDAEVVVINTNGRSMDPKAAASAVRRSIGAIPAERRYLKIDSTLRGNVAVSVAAAVDAFTTDEEPIALVAPAAPAVGRSTCCGWHLVDGALVTDTPVCGGAERPPSTAYLPDLLATAGLPVDRLPIEHVARGAAEIARRLRDRTGLSVIVPDVTHDRHLRALAGAIEAVDRPVLPVGSVGLATHVAARPPFDRGDPGNRRSPPGSGALGIVGSTNPISRASLDALPNRQVIPLSLEPAIRGDEDAASRTIHRAVDALGRHGRAVVTSVHGPDPTGSVAAAADRHAIDRDRAIGRIGTTLAAVAAGVVDRRSLAGLVLTGGDTAESVLDRLAARSIALSGHAVESGVPIGRVDGGDADGVHVVTKAGGFGDERTIVRCLDALEPA